LHRFVWPCELELFRCELYLAQRPASTAMAATGRSIATYGDQKEADEEDHRPATITTTETNDSCRASRTRAGGGHCTCTGRLATLVPVEKEIARSIDHSRTTTGRRQQLGLREKRREENLHRPVPFTHGHTVVVARGSPPPPPPHVLLRLRTGSSACVVDCPKPYTG
jgi:hypothetical protein